MVGVTTEAGTEWSHLVVDATQRTSGVVRAGTSEVIAAAEGPGASYLVVTVPRTAAQTEAALQTARSSLGTVGEYGLACNDCATYAASVLRSAGIWTPPVTSPAINFFTVALQSPKVLGTVALSGAAVNTAVGANVFFSSSTPDASAPASATSSFPMTPAPSQSPLYTPADASQAICRPGDPIDFDSQVWRP
jgi:hypothetical protein